MNHNELKELWRNQAVKTTALPLDQLQAAATRMHRRIVLRNTLENLACAAVIAAFWIYFFKFPFLLIRAGSLLIILGTLIVGWQLRRRASSQPLPADLGSQSWLGFQRSQLVRQRDALRSMWLWYLAPLIPGLAVFRWGVETELGPSDPFARGWSANLTISLILVGIVLLNRVAARKLQRRIDELDHATQP